MASSVTPTPAHAAVLPAIAARSDRWPWILLPGRLLMFALFQALIALGLRLAGSAAGWSEAAAWWPAAVTLTNLASLALLTWRFRQEGKRYWDLFHFDRAHVKGDLLALLGILVLSGPVAMLPSSLLGGALFGDAMIANRLLLAPLPPAGIAIALALFPITQGLVELAYYFRYILPRLEQQVNPWLAYGLACFFLGIQHLAAPLRFDARFLLWRGVMFLPFALLVGAALKWRPRLLPYLAVVHVLIDLATATMYLIPV